MWYYFYMDQKNLNENKSSKIKVPELRDQIKLSTESVLEIEKYFNEALVFLREEIDYLEFYEEYLQHMKDYNEFANQPIKDNEVIFSAEENSKKYSESAFADAQSKIEKAKLKIQEWHDSLSEMTLYKVQFQNLIDSFIELENEYNKLLVQVETERNN